MTYNVLPNQNLIISLSLKQNDKIVLKVMSSFYVFLSAVLVKRNHVPWPLIYYQLSTVFASPRELGWTNCGLMSRQSRVENRKATFVTSDKQ